MPTYKLHYFNSKGFAEVSRLIFAAANVEYEDVRYEREPSAPGILKWETEGKPKMPFGSVPVLEIDGEMLTQSFAIASYLAKTYGFYGSNDMEGARVNEIVEHSRDMIKDYMTLYIEKDETKKAEIEKDLKEVKIPVHLAKFEKVLRMNNGGDGYFVGDKLSMADLQVFNITCMRVPDEALAAVCPKVKALFDRVKEQEGIKKWLANRPVTTN